MASWVDEKMRWPASLAAVKRLETREERFSERPSCILGVKLELNIIFYGIVCCNWNRGKMLRGQFTHMESEMPISLRESPINQKDYLWVIKEKKKKDHTDSNLHLSIYTKDLSSCNYSTRNAAAQSTNIHTYILYKLSLLPLKAINQRHHDYTI